MSTLAPLFPTLSGGIFPGGFDTIVVSNYEHTVLALSFPTLSSETLPGWVDTIGVSNYEHTVLDTTGVSNYEHTVQALLATARRQECSASSAPVDFGPGLLDKSNQANLTAPTRTSNRRIDGE